MGGEEVEKRAAKVRADGFDFTFGEIECKAALSSMELPDSEVSPGSSRGDQQKRGGAKKAKWKAGNCVMGRSLESTGSLHPRSSPQPLYQTLAAPIVVGSSSPVPGAGGISSEGPQSHHLNDEWYGKREASAFRVTRRPGDDSVHAPRP
ncbi:unnamed protein product [Pleuronectes platessa]|uniref:Uncharacterized protein n=1 Tax=Pleuronectes platessa TaxID=8262 RepID=A0A9N7TPU4_PLEPL|nr:unnamed protein product [Pleuronectes platessa]